MPGPDRNAPSPDTSEVVVRLKPLLGMRPGLYLAILYGAVVVLLVFFLLFYPGLRNRGSYFTITTFPDQATVKVDGVYAGSTPCTIFIHKGNRAIEISKPYYEPISFPQKVGGRVFFTLFVRDKKSLQRTLTVKDAGGLLAWALGDFQKNPGIPRITSDAAWAVRGADTPDALYDFLAKSASFTTDPTQLRELLLGASRVASRGSFLSPSSFVSLVQRGLRMSGSYDNVTAWILLTLDRDTAGKLSGSDWVKKYVSSYVKSLAPWIGQGSGPGTGGGVTVAGMSFRAIPGGTLAMGRDDSTASLGSSLDRDLLHPVRVAPFYLGTTEVSNLSYETFIAENPDWAPGNTQALIAKGLVTDGYLANWKSGKPPAGKENLPVTGVSWHAAVAYTGWLSRRVSAALPGYVARLPMESEWEWAARGGLRGLPYPGGASPGDAVFTVSGISGPSPVGTSQPNGYGLRDMLGNVWEWCADSFNRTSYLLSSFDPAVNAAIERSLPDGPDRAVRGGGWGNQPGTVRVWTRGAQPADWCTAWLGFRVALAPR
jgi:formylglycine-generating enzyme required for sulfatase activity